MEKSEHKCPLDGIKLGVGIRTPGIEVEHCWSCGGIFYDEGELEYRLGRPLVLNEWESFQAPKTQACPKCSHSMQGLKRGLMEIFHCTRCKGLWAPKVRQKNKKVVITNYPKNIRVQNPLRPSAWKGRFAQNHDDEVEIHHYLMTMFGFPYEYNEKATRFPVVTISLIFLNTIFFLLSPLSMAFFQKYGFTPSTFSLGQFYTLFTSMFLHADIFHLLGNMYFLWVLGDNIEDRLGSFVYAIFYLGCGLFASLFYYACYPNLTLPSVGASGAISGLIAAYLYLFPNAKFLLIFFFYPVRVPVYLLIPAWGLMQFLLMDSMGSSGVNYSAHLGGFIAGFVVIYLISQRFILELAGYSSEQQTSLRL